MLSIAVLVIDVAMALKSLLFLILKNVSLTRAVPDLVRPWRERRPDATDQQYPEEWQELSAMWPPRSDSLHMAERIPYFASFLLAASDGGEVIQPHFISPDHHHPQCDHGL